MIKKLFLDR